MTETALVTATWNGPLAAAEGVPATADVVIIGGGIVGASTAWFLAQRGVKVVVCEKGYIAGEQSGRNWGWVRVQGRDPREVPMMLDSMNIWRGLADELGEDPGYVEGGCLFTARSDKEVEELSSWCELAQDYELPTRMVTGNELTDLLGEVGRQWRAAMYTPTDGRAEPHLAAPAIARAAGRAGARIVTGCAVRGVMTAAGRCDGVITEAGEIRAPVVLCAAGAWTAMFCRSMDIKLPQLKVRGTVARLAPADSTLEGNLFDSKLGIRRRRDGGYNVAHGSILHHSITPSTLRNAFKFLPALRQEIGTLKVRIGRDFIDELKAPRRWSLDAESPFERNRVLDPAPCRRTLEALRKNIDEVFPTLSGVPMVESWAGMVETTPDVVPVIGEEQDLPGFFVATGFSGHGFGLGPGAGRAIAALIGGDTPPVDLAPFRRQRFYDGSPIEPYTAL